MSERRYHDEEPARGAPKEFSGKKAKEHWPIEELEEYFKSCKLPEPPIILDSCTKIFNVQKFVTSHIDAVKKHNGNKTYRPYYDRLLKFKNIIEKMKL